MAVFCSNCGLCDNSLFCYTKIYKKDPEVFLKHCFKQLTQINWWPIDVHDNGTGVSMEVTQFQKVFCSANVCNVTLKQGTCCPYIFKCISEFKKASSNVLTNKKENKKGTKKYICEPYLTFFTNDRKEWTEEIEEVLKKDKDSK